MEFAGRKFIISIYILLLNAWIVKVKSAYLGWENPGKSSFNLLKTFEKCSTLPKTLFLPSFHQFSSVLVWFPQSLALVPLHPGNRRNQGGNVCSMYECIPKGERERDMVMEANEKRAKYAFREYPMFSRVFPIINCDSKQYWFFNIILLN